LAQNQLQSMRIDRSINQSINAFVNRAIVHIARHASEAPRGLRDVISQMTVWRGESSVCDRTDVWVQ